LNPTKEEVAAHMRKLLPQVFELYTVPAHPRPAAETVLNAKVVLVTGVHFAKSFCARFYGANMQISKPPWILAGKVYGNMESRTPKSLTFLGCHCLTQPIVFS